jgi:HD-like signal output (HDOD) protein
MDRIEIFKSIAAEASRGELVFPTNVSASLKLQQVLDDPDCHIESAIKLVLAEPLLSARTVAMANSAAFNRVGGEITSVRNAVMRLGYRTLHSLVAALIVRQMGSMIVNPGLRAKAAQLWEHTAHVAALAQVMARRVTHLNPETAMFAGIVHEVGGFYLLSRADSHPGLLDGDPEDWVQYGEQPIGHSVLQKLMVPEPVMTAISSMWEGVRVLPPETLGDTLLLANDLAPVESPLHQQPGATTKQSASVIDFAVGNGTLNSILEESAEEVRTLAKALMM